jgi:tetratricopeptide (TPR) repeat protein
LGAAEVRFQQSRGTCEAGQVDADGLRAAIQGYQSALDSPDQPALSDVPTKTAYFLGRAHLCMSQALVADDWQAAEQEFRQVVAEFEGGNSRVKALSAEAHGYLGIIALPTLDDPDPNTAYLRAIDEFSAALNLSGRPDRQAYFYRMLGYSYERLGQYAQAEDAYGHAIALDPAHRDQYEPLLERVRQRKAGG